MTQLHGIIEAAQKAAEDRRRGDESGAKFHTDWANRAIYLEDDPQAARIAFQKAYAQWNLDYSQANPGF